jgi:hypothetical protein
LAGDPLQVAPEAQSVSAVQVCLQTPPSVSQANGAQLAPVGVHWPTAVQVDVVIVMPPSGQLGGAQLVPTG